MRKSELVKIIFIISARKTKNAFSRRRLFHIFTFSLFGFFAPLISFAQIPPRPHRNHEKPSANRSAAPLEKSLAVNAQVNVKLCVAEGNLKINGWNRNEIRVFVAGGNDAVGFKVLQKGKQNDNPIQVAVLGFGAPKNKNSTADECLSGNEIEIDVPRGASVSVKSRESETAIDSVARATIENLDGNIYLSNVAQGIDAKTYEGDITVEKSGGAMLLQTTTGSVVAFGVSPNETGDAFKAKTGSGAIVLRGIAYRQIEANSNSGAIRFAGEFLAGGQYVFGAFNGSINLQIPLNSSCKIIASYGFGTFTSEIPLTNVVKSLAASKAQNLSAQIGARSDATLNLSTYSGKIQIKKL